MNQLTIRGVTPELSQKLASLSRARRQSVNAFVLTLLKTAAGVDERRERLRRYATWTARDLAAFEDTLQAQRTVDAQLWR